MTMRLVRTMVEAVGERISCLESRGGGTTVVLCHSNSTSAELYRALLDGPIGAEYHCVAIDFPGHGHSPASARPEAVYAIPALAAILGEVVERRGWTRYVLVGHSLGGHVMIEALGRLSGAVGLMLVSAPPLRFAELGDAFKEDPTGGLLFAGPLATADVERFASALLQPAQASPADVDAVRNAIASTDPVFRTTLGQSVAAGLLADEKDIVARARVPTAMVHGSEDPFVHAAYYHGARLGAPWKDGVFSVRGHGHSPHVTDASGFEALLTPFLRRCFDKP